MIQAFKNIIEARGWNNPTAYVGIDECLENVEKRLSKRLPEGVEFSLTTLQKKAIAHENFWRDWNEEAPVHNLMIQGATSAGKTLISELNILDTLQHNRKAIVLVPLKAMVHERTEQFKQDMNKKMVYGSSSDYLDNDERLINGDYDVAVIVYEKFFAMLSQGASKIMDNCGLLIVDELSMVGKEQRGPKLEMALEIVMGNYPETRIMCLATCDCSTEKICKWLDIEEPIFSAARPVALEEHIVEWNGEGIYRVIPADHEGAEAEALEKIPEKIEVPGYRNDWTAYEKKKRLLSAVINNINEKNPNARVLVFVGSRSEAASVATFLQEALPGLFPKLKTASGDDEQEKFLDKLSACDRDEGQDKLINQLIPYGIAYHHAGISTTLRELIEEEFARQNSILKVIVATETLTVGVNLPFDAMIMMDSKVPCGMGERVPLTAQEYRNYIGRAGRLGQSSGSGETYLFVENGREKDKYWNSYYITDEVESALTKAKEAELAPYYLSLINNRVGMEGGSGTKFRLENLKNLYEKSLSKICGGVGHSISSDQLLWEMQNAYLASEERISGSKGAFANKNTESILAILPFGKHIAPYAFSVDTCIDIYWYFYQGYKNGGLPLNISSEDVESDKYLLDILYYICRHKEIMQSSVLVYPKDDRNVLRAHTAKVNVLEALNKILNEEEEGKRLNYLWCEAYENTDLEEESKKQNEIYILLHRDTVDDEDIILQAAMRAVVLFYWTKGLTIEEIRKETKFDSFASLISGDIERLAEAASFHLDAIYKCLAGAHTDSSEFIYGSLETVKAFYSLQTRVKYGMPRELVQFANKHIHGLDRARLLKFNKQAEAAELSPTQFLYLASEKQLLKNLTFSQQAQLKQAFERRSSVDEYKMLTEIVSKEIGTYSVEDEASLKAISEWKGENRGEFYDSLKAVLRNNAFSKLTSITTENNDRHINWSINGRTVRVGLVTEEITPEEKEKMKKFFEEYSDDPHIIITPTTREQTILEHIIKEYDCNMVMDCVFLTLVLLKTILIDPDKGTALAEFLMDARGIFTNSDYKHFSLQDYIIHNDDSEEKPAKYRIIWGSTKRAYAGGLIDVSKLMIALKNNPELCDYEILPWGSALEQYDFSACPTIIMLERGHITRSDSLNKFMTKMLNQNFENCMLLLDSDTAKEEWESDERSPDEGTRNTWNTKLKQISKSVVTNEQEAVQEISDFLNNWKHEDYLIGISYAHYDNCPEGKKEQAADDVALVRKLAERLKEEYGEHRILFDEFTPAKFLFDNRGRETSLEAYRTCKVYLILWNYWTMENENCKAEREVIAECCEKGAKCMYLQCRRTDDPKVPEPHFQTALTADRIEDIANSVRNLLRNYPKN